MSVHALLDNPLMGALGWTLLHSLWQGLLVVAVLIAILRRNSEASPEFRHSAGLVALASVLVLPVVTFLIMLDFSTLPAAVLGSPMSGAAGVGGSMPLPVLSNLEPTQHVTSVGGILHTGVRCISVVYILGVLALSFRLMGGFIQAQRLIRVGTSPLSDEWQQVVHRISKSLGVSRTVRIFESQLADTPMTVGWWKPVVLVPTGALMGLSPSQLEAVVAHEVAHIRRNDYLVNLLQCVVETVLFYHPAVWWISAMVRDEREHCCDDAAVNLCGSPVLYARALAQLEQIRVVPAQLSMAANGGSLLGRVRRVLNKPATGVLRSGRWWAGAVAFAGTMAVMAGANASWQERAMGDSDEEFVAVKGLEPSVAPIAPVAPVAPIAPVSSDCIAPLPAKAIKPVAVPVAMQPRKKAAVPEGVITPSSPALPVLAMSSVPAVAVPGVHSLVSMPSFTEVAAPPVAVASSQVIVRADGHTIIRIEENDVDREDIVFQEPVTRTFKVPLGNVVVEVETFTEDLEEPGLRFEDDLSGERFEVLAEQWQSQMNEQWGADSDFQMPFNDESFDSVVDMQVEEAGASFEWRYEFDSEHDEDAHHVHDDQHKHAKKAQKQQVKNLEKHIEKSIKYAIKSVDMMELRAEAMEQAMAGLNIQIVESLGCGDSDSHCKVDHQSHAKLHGDEQAGLAEQVLHAHRVAFQQASEAVAESIEMALRMGNEDLAEDLEEALEGLSDEFESLLEERQEAYEEIVEEREESLQEVDEHVEERREQLLEDYEEEVEELQEEVEELQEDLEELEEAYEEEGDLDYLREYQRMSNQARVEFERARGQLERAVEREKADITREEADFLASVNRDVLKREAQLERQFEREYQELMESQVRLQSYAARAQRELQRERERESDHLAEVAYLAAAQQKADAAALQAEVEAMEARAERMRADSRRAEADVRRSEAVVRRAEVEESRQDRYIAEVEEHVRAAQSGMKKYEDEIREVISQELFRVMVQHIESADIDFVSGTEGRRRAATRHVAEKVASRLQLSVKDDEVSVISSEESLAKALVTSFSREESFMGPEDELPLEMFQLSERLAEGIARMTIEVDAE